MNLRSNFASVIETYVGRRQVVSCELAPVTQLSGAPVDRYAVTAVKVALAGGRVDYVVSAVDERAAYLVDGELVIQGRFGVYTLRDGEAEYRYLHGGARFAHRHASGPVRLPQVTGTVADFTRSLSLANDIVVDLAGPQPEAGFDIASLIGSYLHVATDNVRNGTYQIRGVRAVGPRRYVIAIGDQTLTRGLLDPRRRQGRGRGWLSTGRLEGTGTYGAGPATITRASAILNSDLSLRSRWSSGSWLRPPF